MGKTVRRRHNKDGSITKTTTYSRKNIFGTRITDTYTERIDPNQIPSTSPPKKIRTSNSIAIIIFTIAVIVVPILGISLSWNANFIMGFIKFAIISFVLYMMVNNISPLKRLVIKYWKKNRMATICSIAVIVGFVAIASAIPTQIDSNQSASPSTPAIPVTESEPTTIVNENNDHNEYAADDLTNRFITEFNNQSVYPMTNITQGNIRTKYHGHVNDCWIEIINATEAYAETFNISIRGDNSDNSKEKAFGVFREIVKVLDSSLTDEQISNSIAELFDSTIIKDNILLGDNISIKYLPGLYGDNDYRIDVTAIGYTY